MLTLAASIVVKVTLIAALALIAARLACKSRAAVRHTLLAAMFGALILLPVVSVVAPVVRIAVPTVVQQQIISRFPGNPVDVIPYAPPANVGTLSVVPSPSGFSLSSVLFIGWIAGILLCLVPMVLGLRQIRSLRRSGLPWPHGQTVVNTLARGAGIRRRVEVLLHEELPGPMTCGIIRPAILLPPDAQAWDREDLNRAIVHELEHVRRADWIIHCLARALCAVYWFHPLVWIAFRQLTLEAERSCDDAVLRHSEATVYADQLVGLARRFSTAGKPPLLAMANRADLSTRVRALLDNRQQRGRAGTLTVLLVSVAAGMFIAAISPLRMFAAQPAFEAASIRPSVVPQGPVERLWGDTTGTVNVQHIPFKYLLLHSYNLQPWQLSGPAWLDEQPPSQYFDVRATVPAGTSKDQIPLMFQSLLIERFKLKFHREKRNAPVYALVVGRGGPKLKEAAPAETSQSPYGPVKMTVANGAIHNELESITMPELAQYLSQGEIGLPLLPVVDMTGLTGSWQIVLDIFAPGSDASDPSGGSVLDSLHKAGLDLVKQNGMVEKFVVDYAEKMPTPN